MEQESLVAIYFIGLFFAEILRLPHRISRFRNRHFWRAAKKATRLTERIVLVFVFLGIWILPFISSFTPWLNGFDFGLPHWVSLLAVLVFLIGLIIRLIAQLTLSRSWSFTVETSEVHRLIDHGIYSFSRHPIYVSLIFWAVAQPGLIQNYVAGFSGAVAVILVWLIRVPREEELMVEVFGDDYGYYMDRTGRFFPKRWIFH